MEGKSRADYFRMRRESRKAFNVLVEKEKIEKLESKLAIKGMTKAEWLNRKIDEELQSDEM